MERKNDVLEDVSKNLGTPHLSNSRLSATKTRWEIRHARLADSQVRSEADALQSPILESRAP